MLQGGSWQWLTDPFLREMSLAAITKHLKVLEQAGLITKGREAQWRPCKLNGGPFADVSAWLEHDRWLDGLN